MESDLVDLDDEASIRAGLLNFMIQHVGKDPAFATSRDWFYAIAYLVRGILSERYIRTGRTLYDKDVKRVYYLSMEYLIGRSLTKQLLDLGLYNKVTKIIGEFGCNYGEIQDSECDAALGNGGLGRLAACFMDSLATHSYPGLGYGIRYEYGIFTQRIENGQQVEHPENWLRYGNPWEFERSSIIYPVRFNGAIVCFKNAAGDKVCQWVDTNEVMAMAFDVPFSGFDSEMVTNLRLWSARSSRDFNLNYFNEGDYIKAVEDKTASENLSKVLYPNDKTATGQELRLKQEYFFVSASIQDILSRFQRSKDSLDDLPNKVALQLNDTHPAMAVPELLRLLIDVYGYDFDKAWDIVTRTFSYTNHTLLPEALETWPIDMIRRVLPRHLELIFQINDHFLRQVRYIFPGDGAVLRRMSLVDEERHCIRMAHLAIVASHKVNGVAELHTKLLRSTLFADFDKIYPDKFTNMTNGITPRRWLLQANPELAALISEHVGNGWTKDLSLLKGLEPLSEDAAFRDKFIAIKRRNKERLARLIAARRHINVDPSSMFDVQVKRIHEYKRQLLNILHVITRYNRLRDNQDGDAVKRTVIIGGKAAPGYTMAKLIIRLVNDVAEIVNNDPAVNGRLKMVFIPNYDVTTAEDVIPGSDLSEQISTAGTEASGTGNMKFALNGALTIGTLDGANIEILEEVGEDNIFIFGLDTGEAHNLRAAGYDPWRYYNDNVELKRAIDMIGEGFFSSHDHSRYQPIVDTLLRGGDHYLLLADYAAYVKCQERVDEAFRDPQEWGRKAIMNVANMGKFSSDRTIHAYAKEIWGIKPLEF
ncbi:MAG: glycogen phosphorylase [Rhodospirillales bacterium RIFCSPLOWO2_12_FULL_58_28]|nr:MAG: glycogen phosphorylase [Rhodospirillales bacterium RIFCSPLOWO2_02_FULL_58_16]OHC77035.1 MAG: glycogen phosphorylase [Rhodospirillales bacterium RIFCSPLOWO2_12_FULL_58_28]